MSFLAVFGVFISSTALFVVLAGFNGLKDYTLEFISYASPDLTVSATAGKSFSLSGDGLKKLASLKEFSAVYPSIKERVLIRSNRGSQIVQLNGVGLGFPSEVVDSLVVEGRWVQEKENEIVDRAMEALKYIEPNNLLLAPDCGMKYLERDVAFKKLKVLAEATNTLNQKI